MTSVKRSRMTRSDAEEFTQAVEQVTSGGWRLVMQAESLGVPKALGLSTSEWAEHVAAYVRLGLNERRQTVHELHEQGFSNRQIARAIGIAEGTVRSDLLAIAPAQNYAPDLAETAQNYAPDHDKAQAADESRSRRETSRAAPELDDAFELRTGPAREVLSDVPDSSTPLVLTDPPYGDDAEPLYRWLAEWAERVLIPGGSLIVYTGQSRLDRDIAIFSAKLRYWWLLSMLHTRSQSLPGKFVRAEFKPVLWYVKGHRRGRELVNDVLRSPKRDKTEHDWGQGEAGVTFLIEHLTAPGERILDPFAGTATWGRIAVAMGRRWLGADTGEGATVVAA